MEGWQGFYATEFALMTRTADIGAPHDTCDALLPARHSPLHGQIRVNPRSTIGSQGALIRPLRQLEQLRILDRPGGGFPVHPLLKPRF